MIRLPITHLQLVWLYRLGLLTAFITISWLAFTAKHIRAAELVNDKINHGFAFFVLALLIDNAFPRVRFLRVKLWPLLAYGIVIEIIQRYVARDSSLLDVGADLVGISLYWLLRKWLRQLIVAGAPSVEQRG